MASYIRSQQSKDFLSVFNHALFKVLVITASGILISVLLGIVLFIGFQGVRYFLPMQAYTITTSFEGIDTTENQGISTQTNQSMLASEYLLSHQAKESLRTSLQQKFIEQYAGQQSAIPSVTVVLANNVYLLTTNSGQKILGEFVSINENNLTLTSLSSLPKLQTTVMRLQQNLNDIQLQQLTPLHQDIYRLEQTDVNQNTPLFQKKLSEFNHWQANANSINEQIESYTIKLKLANQNVVSYPISQLQDLYQPNSLSFWQSIGYTLNQIYIFLTDFPKQAATSGGVFPAIFGTLLMVIIMALLVTPFGAISAIYLHEYAPNNRLTSIIRVSVSNMAAVPSVVYGVFGLGFFVYVLGGSIDKLLYSDELPSPTFGTPGLLWASLTMGILTLPVVIVATEEGLSRIPNNLRMGALALGATKYEVIKKVVLPMASPGILTGVILAVARAAGEVAPLILVGAVKFAPTLPIDGDFPFIHLERQFMHLGVFIYDGAFHNQTESQVASLMFATCMLLLVIVLILNISAILLRNKLRNQYERLE